MKNIKRNKISVLSRILILPIKMYRKVSRFTPCKCRFFPSCSSYTIKAISKYGAFRGSFLSIKRILKCNIFFKGGIDEVP